MNKVNRILLFGLFPALYAAAAIAVLFFKLVPPTELFQAGRRVLRTVNWVPFDTILSYITGRQQVPLMVAVGNVAGNVLLFMPLGIYLALGRRSVGKCFLLAVLVSVAVEALQYALGVGYSDVDDVILNGLGGLLGALTVRGAFALLKTEERVNTALTLLFAAVTVLPLLLVKLFHLQIRLG